MMRRPPVTRFFCSCFFILGGNYRLAQFVLLDKYFFAATQNPNAPPGVLFPLRGTMLFNVDFYALDDECYLTRLVDLVPAVLDPLPAGLPVDVTEPLQQATQYLLSLIPSPTIPAQRRSNGGRTLLRVGLSLLVTGRGRACGVRYLDGPHAVP